MPSASTVRQRIPSASRPAGSRGTAGGAESGEAPAAAGDNDLTELALEAAGSVAVPRSWVPRLTLTQRQFDMRCPRGVKVTRYRKCTHEVFAHFGEAARWDGLLERLTFYADQACTKVEEVQELFGRRADGLLDRSADPKAQGAVVERFGRGAGYSLREVALVQGKSRLTHFYSAARLDGLCSREEVFSLRMEEHFQGREDHLVSRSVEYAPFPPADDVPTGSAGDDGARPAPRRRKADFPAQPVRALPTPCPAQPAGPAPLRSSSAAADCIALHRIYRPPLARRAPWLPCPAGSRGDRTL